MPLKKIILVLLLLVCATAHGQTIRMQTLQDGHEGSYALRNGLLHKGANVDVIPLQRTVVLYLYTYEPDFPGDELWAAGAASFDDVVTLSNGSLEVEFDMFRGAPAGTFDEGLPVALGPSVGTARIVWAKDSCIAATIHWDLFGETTPNLGIPLIRLTENSGCCLSCVLPGLPGPNDDLVCPSGGVATPVAGHDGRELCYYPCQ